VSDLAESTLNIQVTFWVDTFDLKILDAVIKSNVILEVLTALEKAGFNLPAKILRTEKPSRLIVEDFLVISRVSF